MPTQHENKKEAVHLGEKVIFCAPRSCLPREEGLWGWSGGGLGHHLGGGGDQGVTLRTRS